MLAEEEGLEIVQRGCARRHTNETLMNAESSRSHAVLMVFIESCKTEDSGLVSLRYSRLNLVDLAGEQLSSHSHSLCSQTILLHLCM